MTTNTASPAATMEKSFNADHAQAQVRLLLQDSARWIADNWLQVLMALGIGSAIVVVLLLLRRWGMKLAGENRTGWGSVAGRAVASCDQAAVSERRLRVERISGSL